MKDPIFNSIVQCEVDGLVLFKFHYHLMLLYRSYVDCSNIDGSNVLQMKTFKASLYWEAPPRSRALMHFLSEGHDLKSQHMQEIGAWLMKPFSSSACKSQSSQLPAIAANMSSSFPSLAVLYLLWIKKYLWIEEVDLSFICPFFIRNLLFIDDRYNTAALNGGGWKGQA